MPDSDGIFQMLGLAIIGIPCLVIALAFVIPVPYTLLKATFALATCSYVVCLLAYLYVWAAHS